MNIIEIIRAKIERLKEKAAKRISKAKYNSVEMYFSRGELTALYELGAFLDTLPEQPVEGLEDLQGELNEQWGSYTHDWFSPGIDRDEFDSIARHFAEWGASHAVAPHYFKLRELKTGRVFLAEWSDMAGEWYERGNGKTYQSDEVEIVQRDKKTPTP